MVSQCIPGGTSGLLGDSDIDLSKWELSGLSPVKCLCFPL